MLTISTVTIATTIEITKALMFLEMANFFPRAKASAGSWNKPTVVQAAMKEVVATKLIPFDKNPFPKI